MLTISPAALDRLSKKVVDKKPAGGDALRFTRQPGGWKLHMDARRSTDETFDHDGQTVLMLDKEASAGLSKMKLVVKATGDGPQLRLVGPPGAAR